MKAVTTTGSELPTPDSFSISELETPHPGPGELQVRIEAVSVNPVDTKVRAGHLKPIDSPITLGWDACGQVSAVGPDVQGFKNGDRVYYAGDVTRPGCNSEYQCIDHRLVAGAPDSLEPEEAAALPLTALTAWEGLFDKLRLDEGSQAHQGERLLIINGAGGVGSIAIQLARALTGIEVIATASRDMSRQWCESLGAHHVVNHHDLVNDLTSHGIDQVDYIFCCHDLNAHWNNMAHLIAPFGGIVAIVETGDAPNITDLQSKSVSLHWEFMFTRSMYAFRPERQGQILARLAGLVDAGSVRTTLNEIMGPLTPDNLAQTHQRLDDGHAIGKLVLTVIP
ncbi:zinc-binding alcohol dehydrogenase family protein [Larsenimonas rhizosphaerae]|uniref:zinc-binding alcohol dehydrogenase family protein n=1 Tax=Larsenimonas rhizosphaerae TaxID=2944682 RepID=UPI00203461AB|nr:zinc-binding alcohol dehydrogenase family protein [Larsenimonas rhizosphaerae]MCM2130531.1 zinc-binding alcohol dehydrogenase family protein [Larsenimonas rhizosphaerae]